MKSKASRDLFLVLVSLYLSGIIYIGTQVLLYVDWKISFVVAVLTFFGYICMVFLASVIVNKAYRGVDSSVKNHKVALYVGTVVLANVFPFAILVSYLSTGELGSSKYYFYATIVAIIVFITTAFYKGVLQPLSTLKKEVLRTQFDLQMEVLKGLITAIAIFLLGSAYSQVLTGMAVSNAEMILAFYTTVGIIAFVLAPLFKSLLDLLGKISDATQDDWRAHIKRL